MPFKRKFSDEVIEFIIANCDKMTDGQLRKQVFEKFGVKVSYGTTNYYLQRYIRGEHVMRGKCKPTFLTKPIGTERIDKDGYIRIIVDVGKERLKHHIVWEQEHEPIGSDEVIMFLDGDKTNCDIKNLVLVKRKYIGAINNIVKNVEYTPEMKKTAILAATLLINARETEIRKNKSRHKPKKQDYKDIVILHRQGLNAREIATRLSKHIAVVRWTIRRYRLGCYD